MTTPFREVVLRFGDAELRATNRDDPWVVEDLAGWFGGVGVKGDRTARLGHGDFPAPNKRTGRSLTLNLLWVGDVQARDHVSRALSGLFADGEEGTLTARVGELVLTAQHVTLDGEVAVSEVGTVGVRAQVPLHAADPFLRSEARETHLRPIGSGVGLDYGLFSRDLGQGPVLSFGSAVDARDWVWNDGNAESFPLVTVTANAPGGFAVSMGSSHVTFPWPTYPDMPVVVDMAGAVSVSGIDQSHLVSTRRWGGIAPSSVESPTFEFLQGGTGFGVVSHCDTYL